MTIYSLYVSDMSHVASSGAVAFCSYITSCRIHDGRTGEVFNGFGHKGRVEHVYAMLPEGAPGKYLGPGRLFSAVEIAEKRSDTRPVKEVIITLPREFNAHEHFRTLENSIS